MAATVDAVSTNLLQNQVSVGSNVTGTLTISASATKFVLHLEASLSGSQNDNLMSFTTITLGGTTLTQVTNARVHANGGTTGFVDLYYMDSPPSGLQTISITSTGGAGNTQCINAFGVSYLGAAPGMPTSIASGRNQSGPGVSSLAINDGELFIGIACNGTSAPTVSVGTSDGTATGDTSTASHGGIRVAHSAGAGSITFGVNSADSSGATGVKLTASGGAAEAYFPFVPLRFDDVLPGEIRPCEVQSPVFWDDVAIAAISADVNVTAYLPIGVVPYADVSRATSVSALLPIGLVPYTPVSRDVSLAAHLPVGVLAYAPVTRDVSLVAHLPVGVVPYTPAVLGYSVTAYLPIGVLPYAPVSKDVSLTALLPVGVTPYAPVSKAVSVVGHLPVGVAPYAPVSRDVSVVGHLSIGAVLYALVTGASDVFVTAYLPIGVDLRAPVSRTASVVGHLPVGTDLRAPVSRTTSVAGFLPVGVTPSALVSKTVSLTAYLPIGVILYAPAGGFGLPPTITYPTMFVVLPNSRLGLEVVPSNLTVELGASALIFVAGPSGLLIPLTPPNENFDVT